MAQLPNPLQYADRRAPRPSGEVISYRPVSGAESAPGEAMFQVGRQTVNEADQMWQRVQVEQKKLDTLRAEEALNTLRQQQIDMTVGEENGFVKKRGSEAVNGELFKTYSNQFNDKIKLIEGQLGNPEQKQMFMQRANMLGMEFQQDLLRHIQGERKTYDHQVLQGTIDVETRKASESWNNQPALDTSLLRIKSAINKYADENGWSKEAREAALLAGEGKVHTTVLQQMLATENYTAAKDYFEKNRAGIDPAYAKVVEKGVQDGVEKQVAGQYRLAYVNTRDNAQGLRKLQDTISKDGRLDDNRKASLLGPIEHALDRIQKQQEMAYNRQVRAVGGQISSVTQAALHGYGSQPQDLLAMVSAAKGTGMEADAARAVALSNLTSNLAMLPANQRSAEIDKLEAEVRANPTGGGKKGPLDWQVIGALRTLDHNLTEETKKDPYGFAVRRGLVTAAPIDWNNPGASAEQLSARFNIAGTMAQHYNAPLKPLSPEEVTAIKTSLDKQPPERKSAWLANLAAASGASPQGRAGYRAIMGQLAQDDPVTASAGIQAARGNAKTSSAILNGQAILNPPTKEDGKPGGALIGMPPETEMRKRFDAEAPLPAYDGNVQARNIDYQTVKALYADKVSKSKSKDTSILDTDLWDQSIKEAMGGFAKINGKQTILPEGVDSSQFKSGLRARINDLKTQGRLGVDQQPERLEGLPVVPVASGVYRIMNGTSYMVDKDNKPIELNFNQPPMGGETPPRRGSIRGGKAPWETGYGQREDGTEKGSGYFGELKRPDGKISTELTVGVEIDGKETQIPTLVPGLSKAQVDHLLAGGKPTDAIVDKAVAHARKRMKDGKSVFAEPGERFERPK